jgi:hypothetical protein
MLKKLLDNLNESRYTYPVSKREEIKMKLTATEMDTVLTLIGKADFDQIVRIAERIKLQRTFITNQNVRSVVVGEEVEFVARGVVIRGVVTKVNRKNLIVSQKGLNNVTTNWKVPAMMVSKVQAVA